MTEQHNDRDALMEELTDAGIYSAPDLHPQEIADAVIGSNWLAARDAKKWDEGYLAADNGINNDANPYETP